MDSLRLNKATKASVQFIFVTILLDAIGIGLLIPVLPDVIRRFTANPTRVSQYFGYFIGVYSLMQFLASPILGSLSDRFGRKSILLGSLLGAAIDYFFMAFAPSLTLLFVGRSISGLTGASMAVASSYMADISDDKTRSANFGMIGAAWGLGFILGPLVGGWLISYGAAAPFLAAAVLNLLNFMFGLLVLPESLPLDRRRRVTLAGLNPFKSLRKVLRPSPFVGLVVLYFLLFVGNLVHPSNWTLYTEMKFGWSAREVGLSLSFVGLVMAIAQGGLTRIIIPKLGEERSVTFGMAIYVVGFFFFATAPRGWMMYAIMVFFALSGIALPALQSIVSRHVPDNEQGELQGSLVSLGSLASIVGPLLYTFLFVTFTKPNGPLYFPGAAYLGASAVCTLALGLHLLKKQKPGCFPS